MARLMWLVPGVAMIVYTLILAFTRNFVPSDIAWIELYLMLVVISTGNNTLLGFYFIIKIGSLSSSCKNACRQQRSNHILHLFHLYHLLPHRNLLNTYFLL